MSPPGEGRCVTGNPRPGPTVSHVLHGVGGWPPGITMVNVPTRSIAVTGMTCEHCASAVKAEISKLPGVSGVDVDVAAGTVRISGDSLPGDTPLREAVEEAGYEFAG